MTTQFTVVSTTGWQPVADETQITIGSTSGPMKQYVIHFGSGGTDYYAFFGSNNAPLQVALAGTTLTVTGTIGYIQRIEEDAAKENTYKRVDYALSFSDDIAGGLQLVRRFIIAGDYGGKPFGKTMLAGSSYDKDKYVYIAGTGSLRINNENYKQFFKNAFTIAPLPALTETITPNTNTLYITASASNFKTTQRISLMVYEPRNFTIGGAGGITVSGFTQKAESGTDNHLVIQIKEYPSDIHGRTQPIIKFVAGTTTASVSLPSHFTGFIEPVSVVEPITYMFLAGRTETQGMVMLDATNIGKITFDTTNKLTIPESSIEPTLTAPTAAGTQLFQLNKETVEVPEEGVYYFSLATIDNSTPIALKLTPLGGSLGTDKYNFTSNDAVYVVRFKLGAQQTDKFPASAQVVGKLINGIAVTGSFGKVPLELTLLGDDSKHQLPYIAIGDGSVPLQTVEHAYALPYDDSYLRSSDLKTAGVSTFPSISAGDVIYNSTMFDIEFSRDTEDLFKVYAEDDEDQNTNIFSVSIPTANINNHIDWRTLGFELDEEGKPKSAPIKNSSSANRVYNVDEGYIDDNYFESAPIIIEYNYMQHVVFNVNSAWSQTTAAKAFSIEEQTSFENLPVNTTDKLMKIVDKGSSRYFALSINNMIYSPSDVSDGKMTLDISQYFSQVIRTLSIYELKATEEDETRVITYSIKQVGAICYNTFNIGLSNAYEDVILKPVSYTPAFVFNFDKIGTLHDYTDTIVPTSITSEADMPDYILQPFDIQTREDLQSFDLMWVVAGMPALDFKGFTPSAPHTIESNKELTITVNNHVDWTATNALTLKGGKWIVNDLSASSPGAIVVGDGSSVVAKGWQNKYLSQLGAPSSIQKNLQTIYDALGNVVQRVPINDTVEYAFNVNGIADSTMKQFETLIASLLQTQVHGGDNRISQYTIEIVTPGDDGFGKVAVKFSLPSKDGKNTKEIIADVSLNLITNTNAEEGTKENDYYVMHYNATSKAIKFVKSNDMSTALDANVYDGVALKLIKTASDTQGKLRLFFNNSSVVITTPLFVDDFDNGTPTTSFTEQPATAVNGRIVYKLDGIENLVLVDTVNVADMTIE